MCTVSVFSSQANLPLSDINRQDNKTLRAQFHIIFSNQRLISCQFAFTLSRMWRFYHHAVKKSQSGTTGVLISYTYCLHQMVCTYVLPKWGNIFTKVTSRPPPHHHHHHHESFIDFWYRRSFRTKMPKRRICSVASCLFSLNPNLGWAWRILALFQLSLHTNV